MTASSSPVDGSDYRGGLLSNPRWIAVQLLRLQKKKKWSGGFVWAFTMAMYASISTITNGPQHPHHLLHHDSSAVHHCLIHNTQNLTVVNTVRFSHQSKGPSPFFTRDRSPTAAGCTVVLLGTFEQNVNHICVCKRNSLFLFKQMLLHYRLL